MGVFNARGELESVLEKARDGLREHTTMAPERIAQANAYEILSWVGDLRGGDSFTQDFVRLVLIYLANMGIRELLSEAKNIWMKEAEKFLSECGFVVGPGDTVILMKLRDIHYDKSGRDQFQRQRAYELRHQYEILFGSVALPVHEE